MAEECPHMVTNRPGHILHGLKIIVLFILSLLFLLPFYVIFLTRLFFTLLASLTGH